MSSLHQNVITLIGAADTLSQLIQIMMIIILGRIIIVSARGGYKRWTNDGQTMDKRWTTHG